MLKEHSLNLKQLAKEVNIPYTTLASWKSRKSGIKLDNLSKIADYFKLPLDYFSDKNLSINNYVYNNEIEINGVKFVVRDSNNEKIIEKYNKLNEEGKIKLLEYADFLFLKYANEDLKS